MQLLGIVVHHFNKLPLPTGNIVQPEQHKRHFRNPQLNHGLNHVPIRDRPLSKTSVKNRQTPDYLSPTHRAHGDNIVWRNAMTIDSAIHDITRHQLCQAGGIALLMLITRGEDLTGGCNPSVPGTRHESVEAEVKRNVFRRKTRR